MEENMVTCNSMEQDASWEESKHSAGQEILQL
jgi:hypothetical protein